MRTYLTLLMGILALGAAAYLGLPARAQSSPSLSGGDVMIIGGKRAHGAARSFPVAYSDFTATPTLEVHTSAVGVVLSDLVTISTGAGTGTFMFTLTFTEEAPSNFTVEIYAHGGTGGTNSGMKRKGIDVRRL